MAEKNNVSKKEKTEEVKKEKKKISPKVFIIIGVAVAALAAVLFLVFDDGLPKNIKTGIEARIQQQFGCEVDSLNSEKKYKVKDSEYDKETIYLVSGVLKGEKFTDGYHVAVLAAVIEVNGEERVVCKTVKMSPDKNVVDEAIKEKKNDPAAWSEELKSLNELVI